MFNLSKEEITFEVVQAFCREWQEGVRVEYKQEITKDIPKIVSSFANTQGGVFIIGVKANQTDNEVQFPIEGIPKTPGLEERIVQSAIMGIYPSVMPEVILVDVPDSDNVVIVVRVDESIQAPHAIQNSAKVYIRTGSVTQPYELSDIDRIEYMFKRRENPKVVTQQILARIEERAKLKETDESQPNITYIIRPVFPYRPIIATSEIYRINLYRSDTKRVSGGVALVLRNSEQYTEFNEYGIVYHKESLNLSDEKQIEYTQILEPLIQLMRNTSFLYETCEYRGNIEISIQLRQVHDIELILTEYARFAYRRWSKGSYDSEISASKQCFAHDLHDKDKRINIIENLTSQLLWSFDIPADDPKVIETIRTFIERWIKY